MISASFVQCSWPLHATEHHKEVQSPQKREPLADKWLEKEKYWTYDWDHFHAFILENKVPELLDRRINQSNLREFLEDNPDKLPKGLNKSVDVSVTVRKPSK